MKARWLVEIAVTSFGILAVAACAEGTVPFGGGGGEGGESEWQGASSSSSSSSASSSNTGGAGGGAASSSSSGGPGSSSSSASSASSASSSGACAESPCKLVQPQCGCAAGQACNIDGSPQGTRICVTAGSTPIGNACTMNDECVPGSLCVKTGDTISTCMKYCSTDSNCTSPGGLCLITLNDGSSGQIPGVTLCTENCDPSTNVGCPVAGTSCQLAQEPMGQMRLLTRCGAAGFGTQGAACTDDGDCAATFGCFNAGTTQCLKYCKVGGAACPGGLTCSSLGMIGNTTYGACL